MAQLARSNWKSSLPSTCWGLFVCYLVCSAQSAALEDKTWKSNRLPNIPRHAASIQAATSSSATSAFDFYGCYLAAQGYTVIKGGLPVSEYRQYNTHNMTNDFCWTTCQDNGFSAAGFLFGYLCYCGNTIHTVSGLSSEPDACNTPCTGNGTEICGGYKNVSGTDNYYQAIWTLASAPPPVVIHVIKPQTSVTSSSSSSTSASSASSMVSTPSPLPDIGLLG
ncbi:hypothetical protein GQ53DRAFT_748326 [Thozetella sp. PMI_491]|nr:hypothetical protein GQ53DRAFT_748326 [Thozetella sp. PMI_491]